jgi:hypothetical protein
MARHDRQIQLAEVGEEGQARLACARVDIPLSGFAGEVATRYLAGAGIGALRVCAPELARSARDLDPDVHVEVAPLPRAQLPELELPEPADGTALACQVVLEDAAARELARGAIAALRAIKSVLGMGPAGPA